MSSTIGVSPQPYINKIRWILETRTACIKAYRDDELVYLRAKGAKTWFIFGRLLTDEELVSRYVDRWSMYYEIAYDGASYGLGQICTMLLNAEYGKEVRLSKEDINMINGSFSHWSTKNEEFNCCESYKG